MEMRAGKLFEAALKKAEIELKTGTEIKIQVRGKGSHLKLVVSPPKTTPFEAEIMKRAKSAELTGEVYNPDLPVGEMIRVLRKSAGMTLEALALKADMSKGSLCSIEKGSRSVGLAIMKKLAKALGVSVNVLMK
jgi:DNA-binding XRE family transcriptional regulator